jgi:hypothetical protein
MQHALLHRSIYLKMANLARRSDQSLLNITSSSVSGGTRVGFIPASVRR